jgi:hypothetical protein
MPMVVAELMQEIRAKDAEALSCQLSRNDGIEE